MNWFRKNRFLPAALLFAVLLAVLVAESFHHHEGGEEDRDCSLCSWQLTSSNATPAAFPALFIFVLVTAFVVGSKPITLPFFTVSPRGRSPPRLSL